MIVDIAPGLVTIRDAESILGLTIPATVTPDQARIIAEKLMREGEHTVAADGLLRAAEQAEKEASR